MSAFRAETLSEVIFLFLFYRTEHRVEELVYQPRDPPPKL